MLRLVRRWFWFSALSLLAAMAAAPARAADGDADVEFTVMAYNVEMLFDIDGVALLDDFKPERWGATQLDRKLAGISRVLQQVRGGRGQGPDIICFNELEADQTPDANGGTHAQQLARLDARPITELLRAAERDPALAGLPVEVWLARRLADDGMSGYHVAVGRWREDPTGHLVFHTNAVFSRFPIVASRTHDTAGARGILEVELEVGGQRLHVFNNHWKSGASDPATEPTRIGNATVLRTRLDAILREDPHADVILAGDFNSQYNQRQRYPDLARTAINDVLGSQGDERALLRARGAALYNLWFELPEEKRGSDEYHGEWGTLMHLLVTRGLYDARGVQYVDNTFAVAAFPGLNAEAATGRPIRWTFAGGGAGFADHFPITARFRAGENLPRMKLVRPSTTPHGPATAVPVELRLDQAVDLTTWPRDQEFRTSENHGRFFRARGRVSNAAPFRVRLDGTGIEIMVWVREREPRVAFFAAHPVGEYVSFVGELSQFRGEWQLVIPARALP